MADAFDRLSPAMQYQIVNGLGFDGLRPVQEDSIEVILDGKNCVVLAPTAGGKTEASFFPVLSRMDTEDWKPVSVLYIAPIRALLNNQEARLLKYAKLIGRTAFKWHGDVPQSARKAFLADPADILLTTPESLEAMLMSSRVPAKSLFRDLQAVVIDEIHAFVGDDRGGHLSSVLERLTRICGNDVQRIGLSATVGNPEGILKWVQGSSRRSGAVVNPGGAKQKRDIEIDWVSTLENAATIISQKHLGEKRLVFVDSRRKVEALGQKLRELGVDAYVTHSSLSVDERSAAERAFEEGKNCVIVATSALELGIDIGDLDRVIQIDSPSTVAGFLQRMGRTGRRGAPANCLFLCTDDLGFLRACAIERLYDQGFVESLQVPTKSSHLLAHQLMALTIQHDGGVPIADWWSWVRFATPFQGLSDEEREQLLAHMLKEDIIFESGGRYALGKRGEKLYGRRNFSELYAVFSTPKILSVMYGGNSIGSIDISFAMEQKDKELTFVLGAKAWRAVEVNWKRGVVRVEPLADGGLPRWEGNAVLWSYQLCQAMKAVLTGEDISERWSKRAREKITNLRHQYGLDPERVTELEADEHGLRLWTFGGGKANNLLGRLLEAKLGEKVTIDNLYIGFRKGAAKSRAAINNALAELRSEGRPNHNDAVALAELCARGQLTKFQPCLPERLEAEYLAQMLMNEDEARLVLGGACS